MNARSLAPAMVRWGMSAVMLWFGIQMLITPEWFYGFVPGYAPFSVETTVLLNAVLQIVLGAALALGLFVRVTATISTLHMLVIALSVGYNDIMARDIALTFATASVALYGEDDFCWRKKWNTE